MLSAWWHQGFVQKVQRLLSLAGGHPEEEARSAPVRRSRRIAKRHRNICLALEPLETRTLLSFLPPLSFPTGPYTRAVAVGDLNGDNTPDLVTADYGPVGNGDTISVLLGNGDGTFRTAQDYAVGRGPFAAVLGDLRGKGVRDIVVASYAGSTVVSVLLNNGDGTFQPAQYYPMPSFPTSVAVGDFNGDNKLDIAVAQADGIRILLGNGDGSFQSPILSAVSPPPLFLAVADFNQDGIPDLVATNFDPPEGRLTVLLGNGDGSFRNAGTYYGASSQFFSPAVAVGDLHGDQIPDIVAVNSSGNTVSVFLGNGDGSFQDAATYQGGGPGASVRLGDLNCDGILDIVTTGFGGPPNVSLLLGNGDGSFKDAMRYDSGGSSGIVAAADLNGDGYPDLVLDRTVLLNAADWNGNGSECTANPAPLTSYRAPLTVSFALLPASAKPVVFPPTHSSNESAAKAMPPPPTDQVRRSLMPIGNEQEKRGENVKVKTNPEASCNPLEPLKRDVLPEPCSGLAEL